MRPDPAKVRAIKVMAALESASDVWRFLSMCNYLSRFIHNLSQASEPLRWLTEGEAEFHWGSIERAAFEEVKSLIPFMMWQNQWSSSVTQAPRG